MPNGQEAQQPRRLHAVAAGALIGCAALLAYLPALRAGFILDDDLLLTQNDLMKSVNGLWKIWFSSEPTNYWPVTYTSLWAEWRLWGLNPAGYHATNLALHIATSLLLWVLLQKLKIPGAMLAALLFAVHPVNVESVAWIAQRKNLLAMLFFLLSILAYLKADRQPWYWLSLLTFVLAMLSKGSVAILPAVLVLVLLWQHRQLRARDLLRIGPFVVVAASLVVVNIWFQTHGKPHVFRHAGPLERVLGAAAVPWFYLYKAVLPINLLFIYPYWRIDAHEPRWWAALLAVVGISVLLAWSCRRRWGCAALFAWAYFLVCLFPTMGFTYVGFMTHSLVADRYQHLAIIGVIALAAAVWERWHRHASAPALTTAGIVVCALTYLTWQQSALYRDAKTLYSATLERNPKCWLLHLNLGDRLLADGQKEEAIAHFKTAIELKPDYAEALNNLGNALQASGRANEAIPYLQRAVQSEPDYAAAHNNLGNALTTIGQFESARHHLEEALRLRPAFAVAHGNLANLLIAMGHQQEAFDHFREAIRLDPDLFEAHHNYAFALFQAGLDEQALAQFEQALRLRPGYATDQFNIATVLIKLGRGREAIPHLEQAINLANASGVTGLAKRAEELLANCRATKP